MNSRVIEMEISSDLLGQGIAPLLHTLGMLNRDEFIGDIKLPGTGGVIPVKLEIFKEQEVSVEPIG